MSTKGKQIRCRKCNEIVSTEVDHCPQCGTAIRNDIAYIFGILLGIVIMVAAVFAPGDILIYGVIGALVALGSGYLLYEKRQRIQQANEQV